MIASYVDDLARELRAARVPGRAARRLVAETRDHLLELAATDGEAEAVRRFGSAREVAAAAAAGLATARTRRASYVAFGALALAGFGYAASILIVQTTGGWPDIASGEIAILGGAAAIGLAVFPQIAFVAGCLALLRTLRSRHEPLLRDAELGLVRRRVLAGLGAGGLTLASWAVWAIEYRDAAPLAGHGWVPATILALSGLLALPLGAGIVAIDRAGKPRPAPGGRAGDVFDDLEPLFTRTPVARFDLPTHAWRFALLVAGAIGTAATVLGWIAEGDPGSGLVRGVFEAVALLVCFAALARPLGLRR